MRLTDVVRIEGGEGPLVATALHNGNAVREEIGRLLNLSLEDRRREEDPFTALWTVVAPTRIVGRKSRFEVDLNRPREKAVYRRPEDAWGLIVWKNEPPENVIRRSLGYYDLFYAAIEELFRDLEKRHGKFVVYDVHSYNHVRGGPSGQPGDPEKNPEVNVGTGTMNRARWAPIVDRFMRDLESFNFEGRSLDVRENVRFQGGEFPRWTHETFPESACVLAIEFKKIFMDEWTGELNRRRHQLLKKALETTVPGVMEELNRL